MSRLNTPNGHSLDAADAEHRGVREPGCDSPPPSGRRRRRWDVQRTLPECADGARRSRQRQRDVLSCGVVSPTGPGAADETHEIVQSADGGAVDDGDYRTVATLRPRRDADALRPDNADLRACLEAMEAVVRKAPTPRSRVGASPRFALSPRAVRFVDGVGPEDRHSLVTAVVANAPPAAQKNFSARP